MQSAPMPAPASEAEVRRFGTSVFLLAETIFFGGLLYLLATRETHGGAAPEVLLLLAAAGCALIGALMHRVNASLLWPFFGCVCALVCCVSFVVRALDAGWTPWAGPKALAMHMLLEIWAIHLLVLMLVFGFARIRGRAAAPGAVRVLLFLGVVGIAAGVILT
jgi:heme/copper-type cytochrome/quinol oxidase subunit 3